ncbi:MAG: hypothetical protein ACRC0X_02200 [Brevinema sp.]
MQKENIEFLLQAHAKLEQSIEKLARSVESLAEKNYKSSERTNTCLQELAKEVSKLIERDKVQNKRLDHIEKQLSNHDHIIKIGIGGGIVLLSVLRMLGVPI